MMVGVAKEQVKTSSLWIYVPSGCGICARVPRRMMELPWGGASVRMGCYSASA